MADFGTDIRCLFDLDPLFGVVFARENLAQALVHRLTTPRGTLLDDPAYGIDTRAYVSESLTAARLYQLKVDLETELERDERIQTADTTLTPLAGDRLRLSLVLSTKEGPFTLVLAVSALTVELLQVR